MDVRESLTRISPATRAGLTALGALAALAAIAYGLASAALLNQSRDSERAVVTAIARGFAADFDESQLERPAPLQRRVDALRDLHPSLREASIVVAPGGRPTVLVSTRRARERSAAVPEEAQPLDGALLRYDELNSGDADLARVALALRDGRRAPAAALSLTYDPAALDSASAGREWRLALAIALAAALLAALAWVLLARDVSGALARRSERDELASSLAAAEERIADLTLHDDLTGLLNNHGIQEWLSIELLRAQRWGYQVTVVSVDIDHLSEINDGWGEEAGDEALRLVAEKMSNDVRPGDLCARLGDDEFMLALTQTGGSEAEDIVHRLRATVADLEFIPAAQSLTISAGIAQFPYDAGPAVELMRLAQRAMRRSKTDGGDRCTVYVPELGTGLYA